jgi:hypothetical protein
MPIQFCCAQCGQPIEVDDEHAGQTATCPYCRHVMSIPQQSTYQPEAAVAARALGGSAGEWAPAGGPTAELPPAPGRRPAVVPAPRQRAARTLGSFALLCALLALLLMGAGGLRALSIAVRSGKLAPASTPTPADITELQQQAAKDPWVAGPQLGATLFALVGLVLAIASLVQATTGNWRGLTAGIICGLFFLCLCGGVAFSLLTGFGMPATG